METTGSVLTNRGVAQGQFLLSFKVPGCFPTPAPGQFVMLRGGTGHDPLLRRPFSIHAFHREGDCAVVEILYQIAGTGTRQLSRVLPKTEVRIMGPLGQGFAIVSGRKNVIIIAGGMGMAPLSFLAEQYLFLLREKEAVKKGITPRIICYMGAKTSGSLVSVKRMEGCCGEIKVSTDDGSAGYHGTVVELFRRDIAFYHPDDAGLYACGPAPMLKGLAELCAGTGITCQVSMEERMACGLGACLGCAVSVQGKDGKITYKRVCKDGPVFNIHDILWT